MRKKQHILLFFIFFIQLFIGSVFAQNKKIDSLLIVIKTENNDTSYIKNLLEISRISNINANIKQAKYFGFQAIKKAEQINYRRGVLIGYYNVGEAYIFTSNYDSALFALNTLLRISDSLNDKPIIANAYILIAEINFKKNLYKNALTYSLKAIKINEQINNKKGMIPSYNAMAIIYYTQKNETKALENFLKAKHLAEAYGEDAVVANIYNSIASIYMKKCPDTALIYLIKALRINEKIGYKHGEAMCLLNIGEVHSQTKNFSEALKILIKATTISKNIEDYELIAFSLFGTGSVYKELNNLKESEKYLKSALKLANQIGYKEIIKDANKALAEVYERNGNYKEALNYHKFFSAIKDTMYTNENAKQIAEINTKYETEKKDNEINILNKDKEKRIIETKIHIAEKEKKIVLRNAVIIIVIIISVLVILIYAYLMVRKQKKMQNQFTKQLIDAQEEERKRISKELHDGIGQNLLIIKSNSTSNTNLIQSTIDELRTISRNMHPAQLEKLGFQKAVENTINEIENSCKIFFSHEIEDINTLLSNNQQINLYRIVQEALNNIIKHSQAQDASVSIIKSKNKIITTIIDNGCGFNKNIIIEKSMGLNSIKERVNLINGKLILHSDSKGTKIEIEIKV